MKPTVIFVLAILLLSGCNRNMYKTSSYEAFAAKHRLIAVLPAETITTGRIPEELTPEMIRQIEENESKAFQIALFDQVSRHSGRDEGKVNVRIQHYSETNARLEQAGIGIRESWKMAPSELAGAIGVDAVVRTTVRKEWYLTDLESFGLSMARTFLAAFTNAPWWFIPSKTSDVFASCAVLDGESGIAVWSTEKVIDTDWNTQHGEVVRRIARTLARRFPYRD